MRKGGHNDNRDFGGTDNTDGGLLSHSNPAKILIKLCRLTVVADNFVLSVCVCSYLYVWEVVYAQIYLFPLLQCTYIGPTVHKHNLLLSFKQRTHSFLNNTLIQTTLKYWPACPVYHMCCLPAITAISFNLLIIWNDQPVLFMDGTHVLLTQTSAPN